ncbi:MAG: type VI secretion system tip protein VgrG [Burkholderiales bacterium]|nr:type VI secretion system tip protein VgrG [Burkholderiales bacterium]MDE2454131.1 type VI secretion system tip protein VgrG [Burkholderiales bacterium]
MATPLQMKLVTALGETLLFRSMSAHEEVSRLFEFQVIGLSESEALDPNAILGTPAKVSLEVADDTQRWFHGIVAAFGIDGVDGRLFRYRLTLRPWLWLLTRSAGLRIYQQQSALDIVKTVFGDYSGAFVDETSGSYSARDYCVQYRETDFNFVSRLLEEEGIFYYFRHSADKHELVLADKSTTHAQVPGFETIRHVDDVELLSEIQAITGWNMRQEIQAGKYTLSDYNFETPSASLLSATAAASRSHAEATLEVYDYPGLHGVKADGDARAAIRLEEHSGRFGRYRGQGNTPGLVTGCRFTLAEHPRDDQNAEYIVLQTRIDMRIAGYESSAGGDDTGFRCSFVAQAFSEPLRPPRITRKPAVAGPQTALVVGSGGDGAIDTDLYGRVKVQFYWDRLGAKDEKSSCWLRVASPWAGNGWGVIQLPRIGQEVVVDFLEGDPDHPLITGRVYNAEQLPPYPLPDNASVSTTKSRSIQGGAADFNELRFEDKAGSEYVWLQAQKDLFERVENDHKSQIDGNQHLTLTGDRKEKVKGTEHVDVTGEARYKYGAKFNLATADDMLLESGGVYSLKTSQDFTVDSGATLSFQSSTDLHMKIGANIGQVAQQNVHLKGGMNVVIEAGMELTIVCGGSSIVLGPSGVSITGAMVNINSGGAPGSGAGASPVATTAPADPEAPEAPSDPLAHR